MNYLAHIFLSGNNRQRQVGNFIGDFVKGNQLNNYPEDVKRGIILHRRIDSFTDTHPAVRNSIALLRPQFGRYSGILVDMYFDHFLANDFTRYSENKRLFLFSADFYLTTIRYYHLLPPRVKGFIWHFISTNRLYRYSTTEGLDESLTIMATHKTSAIRPKETIDFLNNHFSELEMLFHQFFPDLRAFVEETEQKEFKL